jgi:uncharacterized protein (DUF362 family)
MPQQANQDRLTRRQFIRMAAAAGLGTALAACTDEGAPIPQKTDIVAAPDTTVLTTATAAPTRRVPAAPETTVQSTANADPTVQATATGRQHAYLSVARGNDPAAITRAALSAIGGIGRFVVRGDDVIVKPNICVDYRSFEYGATTNPDVVATLVEECLSAGAKRVRVMDLPFGGAPESAYARSGIAAAVTAAGGEMEVMNSAKFREVDFPEGRDITRWPVYQDVLTTDVLIDVPIAKHHSLARLSLAGKNLMGVILNRGGIHSNLGQRVADLVSLVRPTLTVVDAVRTLMAHGPTGGNLDDVRLTNTVIASHDIVAADAYAATLFDLTGKDIHYVRAAAGMGLGTLDLEAIEIEEVVA